MTKFLSLGLIFAFALVVNSAQAEEAKAKSKKNVKTTVEFVSTGEGAQQVGQDPVIADDPYKGKSVTEKDLAGSKLTQQAYDEKCTDDRCVRAKKRQLSEDSSYKDDYKDGLRVNPYGSKNEK